MWKHLVTVDLVFPERMHTHIVDLGGRFRTNAFLFNFLPKQGNEIALNQIRFY
jgi:hypothetical protein